MLCTECFQKLREIVHLQAWCPTQLTDRKDYRLHLSLLNVLKHAGLLAEANTPAFFCKGMQDRIFLLLFLLDLLYFEALKGDLNIPPYILFTLTL